MKTYKCKKCKYETGLRKLIRAHVRNTHHIKPLKREPNQPRILSPITKAYKAIDL